MSVKTDSRAQVPKQFRPISIAGSSLESYPVKVAHGERVFVGTGGSSVPTLEFHRDGNKSCILGWKRKFLYFGLHEVKFSSLRKHPFRIDTTVKFRVLVIGGISVLLFLGGATFVAWRAAQSVPEFYQHALELPADVDAAADGLERQVLNLQQEIQQSGAWQIKFTTQEINAWMAARLEQHFAGLIPDAISNLRFAIEDERAHLACQYRFGSISTILSLTAQAYLTEEPNVFAIQFESARAGLLPIPLKSFASRLRQAAERANVNVRWTQTDNSPVALVTLPMEEEGLRDDVILETLELREGELFVAGNVRNSPELTASVDQVVQNTNCQR